MTPAKAIEYLDIVLKAHPRLRPGVFGQAVQMGKEALERIQVGRNNPGSKWNEPLPGEDPIPDLSPSPDRKHSLIESNLGRESGQ